jgi:hypothetical protein
MTQSSFRLNPLHSALSPSRHRAVTALLGLDAGVDDMRIRRMPSRFAWDRNKR